MREPSPPRKIAVGIGGASGAPYAERLLEILTRPEQQLELAVILSRTAEQVWKHECKTDLRSLGVAIFEGRDYGAPVASGSAGFEAMVVIPASMSCIARIAHGISDDLLTRAADVMLKERRQLVLVPRETPVSVIHLENMLRVAKSGAMVLPASPSFYGRPTTLQAAMDTVIARVLDHLQLPNELTKRWGSDVTLED